MTTQPRDVANALAAFDAPAIRYRSFDKPFIRPTSIVKQLAATIADVARNSLDRLDASGITAGGSTPLDLGAPNSPVPTLHAGAMLPHASNTTLAALFAKLAST